MEKFLLYKFKRRNIDNISTIIEIGKIDYIRSGKKSNLVTLELELKNILLGKPVFTCSGNIYNHIKTDCYCFGQILDKINSYFSKHVLFSKIFRLWKLYHLNDMHAGTEAQEDALDIKFGNKYPEYKECCEYLKSINLYEDNGYKYGHSWIYREISSADLIEIINIIDKNFLNYKGA